MANTIEWAPFRLKNNISETQLLDQAEQFQTRFLQFQIGYSERQLLKHSDGYYVDLIYWYSAEEAQAAAEQADKNREGQAYFALMQALDVPINMQYLSMLKRF